MISEKKKKVLQGDFGRKKRIQIHSWEKKHPAMKKISLMTYNAENKILYLGEKISNSREVWEKNSQTKSVKSPIPDSPTNFQWSCQPFSG